jgi:membrane-associated phospholipid phosphatase
MRQDRSDQSGDEAFSPSGESVSRPPTPPAHRWQGWRPFVLPAVLLVAAMAALTVDCPLAQWRRQHDCPGELQNLLQSCEPFGDGVGVLLIVLAIHQLDPRRRWALPRILACAWGAGLAANLAKLLIARQRPRYCDLQGGVWATFEGWFPLLKGDHWTPFGDWLPALNTQSRWQSLPSGHAATAAGLAMALIWLYPAGRKLLPLLVVLVACHRIEAEAHYLSDVLCGAAVGVIVATACLTTGRLAKWFDRLEDRWRSC